MSSALVPGRIAGIGIGSARVRLDTAALGVSRGDRVLVHSGGDTWIGDVVAPGIVRIFATAADHMRGGITVRRVVARAA